MEEAFSFNDLSVEMTDFEVKKRKNYHYSFWLCTEGGSIDNKPLIFNGMIFFGSFNHNLYALDIRTGKEVWKFRAQDRIGLSSPQLHENSVIIGSYDHNVYCLEAAKGGLKWKHAARAELASSGAVDDGVYFFTGRDKMIYAIDCNDGSLVWKHKTFEPNVSVPTILSSKVFFGSSDRNLYCLDKRNGHLLWKFGTEDEVVNVTPFIVHKGAIYFGTLGNYLYAVDISSGKMIWRFPTGIYGMTRGQVLFKNLLIQPTNDGILYAITLDGKLKWKFTKNEPFGAVATDGERLYVGCEDHYLYCVSGEGKELWKFRTRAPIWQPATILNGIVYFGSYDCNLYALVARTGKLVWKFKCPGGITTYPEIKDYLEVRIKIPESEIKEEKWDSYQALAFKGDEDSGKFYKSRITYHVSSRYHEKGKYQIDSDEEAL
jgi:outer membrane protein assembly factor BamB